MNKKIPTITKSEFSDFATRAKYLYHIRSEDNLLIGYEYNQAQTIIDTIRREEFERSKLVRGAEKCKLIILKSRQIGATTDTAMYNLDIMLNLNMARGTILAHDDKSTPVIYHKYKLAFDNLPDYIQILEDDGTPVLVDGEPIYYPIKPQTESYSGFNLQFANKTKSNVYVRTAGSGDNIGKGDTQNFIHLSEAANYDYYSEVIKSVNQQISAPNSFAYAVIESTANGISGKGEGFYNSWVKAEKEWNDFVNGRTKSFDGYRPVFIPWYKLEKYKMPLIDGRLTDISNIDWGSPENKKEYLQVEEQIIEETFEDRNRGLEAANWYRHCIKVNCEYDYISAKRYYPTRPEDAFIASDRGFFNSGKLFAVKQGFEKNGEREHERGFINDNYEFVEDKTNYLIIWKHPEKDYHNRYIVSLDPAHAIEGGDFSCMFVFDRLKEEFVAKWYGNLKEDLLAEELLRIAYYYNEALIIPETNLKTVMSLVEPEGLMPYTGPIYERIGKSRDSIEYGFNTLGHNKSDLLMTYNRWLRENYEKIPDISTLDEHTTFIKYVQNGRPKYEASKGKHDDQVISAALCLYAHEWWDDEIFTSTRDGNDIDKIFQTKKKVGVKASKLRASQDTRRNGNVKLSTLI